MIRVQKDILSREKKKKSFIKFRADPVMLHMSDKQEGNLKLECRNHINHNTNNHSVTEYRTNLQNIELIFDMILTERIS